jgi:hypothetical protein
MYVANNRLVCPATLLFNLIRLNDVEVLYSLRCVNLTGDNIASNSHILVLRPVSHFEHLLCSSLGYCLSDNRSQFSKRVDLL